MADLVSPMIDIISRLWPCCATRMRYLCKLQENKILLRNAMDELKEARDDVHKRVVEAEADLNEPRKRTDPVHGWLQRVEIIEVEVEEILQKPDEQLSRGRCLGGCCPPKKCWSNYKLGKSIVMKMASVDELKGKGQFQEVTYPLPPLPVQDMSLDSTVGMESSFDKVWRLITSKDDKHIIMGLYGKGGVGKTTLLEKINNEFNKSSSEHGFDHVVIFVVVSKPINFEKIQEKIGERLGLSNSLQGDGDENSRASKIFNKLKNKNFVILLDDIWERVDFKRIGIPSPVQCNSSKVIFTTRNKEVCGLMKAKHTFQVECLPWDKAWGLFQETVGEEALTSFPRARELAELLAKECGGLPLALITIGQAMSTKKTVQEWNDTITTLRNSASKFPGMSDDVLPRLKLSYDNLRDNTLKSCFLYCALFPEDYNIDIHEVVDYWIGEGFFNEFDKNLDEARNRGRHVVETLKRACLLESGRNEKTEVKMHDIIRDLALWIVNDCNSSKMDKFLFASCFNTSTCEEWKNAERILWMNNDSKNNELENPPTSPNLVTLIIQGWGSYKNMVKFSLPRCFFQFTPLLKVLDFSFSELTELPTSICELSDLQYLGLAWTYIKELPVELKKLVKLKFLDLTGTFYLRKIPPGMIANLSELRVLNLYKSGFEDWELKDGKGLSFCELDRLKHLQQFTLTIGKPVAFKKLLHNQKLRMICKDLELTSGFRTLKDLELSSFPNLHEIVIRNCDALKDITCVVYVVNLKRLEVSCCDGLETIIELVDDDDYDDEGLETLIELGDDDGDGLIGAAGGGGGGGGGGVFEKLEDLYVTDLPKLKSISRHALVFPSIKVINVLDCPELKKLSLDSGSNINNTLKLIRGSTEWWDQLEWEDETIKSKFLPFFKGR